MAEFSEVMKQYYRLCETQSCTPNCLLKDEEGSICATIGRAMTDKGIERVEKIIMQWAAEHPEPKYPTWAEYLEDNNILEVDFVPRATSTTICSKSYIQTVKTLPNFYRPIPADIAHKLGIKPKEE